MIRPYLAFSAALLSVLLAACAGAGSQQVEVGGGADAPPPSTPPARQTPTAPPSGSRGGPLPPAVTRAVLGEHLDGWFVWQVMPWDDPFLPRCDQLPGSEEACARARDLAGTAQAGELVVLGPSDPEELSLEEFVQGLSQLVVVLPDEAAAEQMSDAVREVVVGWGAEARDLPVGDDGWAADHFDTAPGGFAEIDPALATRMVAVREGRTVVVLSHADDPDSPRLETEPIARDIAQRLTDSE